MRDRDGRLQAKEPGLFGSQRAMGNEWIYQNRGVGIADKYYSLLPEGGRLGHRANIELGIRFMQNRLVLVCNFAAVIKKRSSYIEVGPANRITQALLHKTDAPLNLGLQECSS